MRPSVALLFALAAGCGITARPGQFRCPDGRCPSGLVCAADGVCRTPGAPADGGPPGLDGGDAGPTDVGGIVPDVPGLDAPDAPPPESCDPDPLTRIPLDEDRDGLFDEVCPFAFGPMHPVLAAM